MATTVAEPCRSAGCATLISDTSSEGPPALGGGEATLLEKGSVLQRAMCVLPTKEPRKGKTMAAKAI
jgi:hypothetical protein